MRPVPGSGGPGVIAEKTSPAPPGRPGSETTTRRTPCPAGASPGRAPSVPSRPRLAAASPAWRWRWACVRPPASQPPWPALFTWAPPTWGARVATGRRDPRGDLGPRTRLGAPGTGGLRMALCVSALCGQRRLFHPRWVPGPEATKAGGQGSRAGQGWAGAACHG